MDVGRASDNSTGERTFLQTGRAALTAAFASLSNPGCAVTTTNGQTTGKPDNNSIRSWQRDWPGQGGNWSPAHITETIQPTGGGDEKGYDGGYYDHARVQVVNEEVDAADTPECARSW